MQRFKGFTLIELMITIAVLAIISLIAAPSMGQLLEKQNFQKRERELMSLVSQTKSLAIIKRTNVKLNLDSTVGNTDSQLNWSKGANESLQIQTLAADQTLGNYTTNEFTFDKNGLVSSLNQDALISICNSKLKVKKILVLTKLGTIYKKPEETC